MAHSIHAVIGFERVAPFTLRVRFQDGAVWGRSATDDQAGKHAPEPASHRLSSSNLGGRFSNKCTLPKVSEKGNRGVHARRMGKMGILRIMRLYSSGLSS